jgi:hypothetical protein
MTRPFSDAQKLRILVNHGAMVIDHGQLKPIHHTLWGSPHATKRMEQLRSMFVAVRCACGGALSSSCDGTQWLRLADVEFDHHLAHTFGGATHQENGRPLAPACHAVKSAGETKAVKKIRRILRKALGKKPKRIWPSRPMKGGSKWPSKKAWQQRSAAHAAS